MQTFQNTLRLPDNFGELLKGRDILDGVLLFEGDPRAELNSGPLPPRPPLQIEVITPEQLQSIAKQVEQQKIDAANRTGPKQYFKAPDPNKDSSMGVVANVVLGVLVFGTIVFIGKNKVKKVKL